MTIKKVLGADLVQTDDTFVASVTGIKAPERDEPLGAEVYEFTKRSPRSCMEASST